MNVIRKSGPGNPGPWNQPLQDAVLQGLAFVSRAFWGPDLEFCTAVLRDDGLISLADPSLLRCRASSGDILGKLWAEVRAHDDGEALFQHLEERYVTLFVSNRQGIAAPLYHSCYVEAEGPMGQPMLMGAPAVEMKKRLVSSGLAVAEDLNQPPDHLCIEIEYLYFLLQEVSAGNGHDRIAAVEAFAADWMLPWVRKLRDRLDIDDGGGFYHLVLLLLTDLLKCINPIVA